MTFKLIFSTTFKKSYKLCKKRHYDMSLLDEVLHLLETTGHLPEKYKPHILHGDLDGVWECHIASDWLLLWERQDNGLILYLMNTGTHSDLFK